MQGKLIKSNSKLIAAWESSGRTRELLEQRLADTPPLSGHELDLLEKADVRVTGNERFFKLAKAMLPYCEFISLLSEAKGDNLEGKKAKKNQTARLIWRLKSAILALKKLPLLPAGGLDN